MKTIDADAATQPHPISPVLIVAGRRRPAERTARAILALLAGLGSASAIAEREAEAQTPLVYGHTYSLQNGYTNWYGGYLDTRGSGCQGNDLCVSTAYSSARDGGSGSWILTSADGKPAGALVASGDRVHLQNLSGGNGGYLDTDYSACQGDYLCVSTAYSSARDGGSGTWTIAASATSPGALTEGQDVHLQNQWSGNGGYLDTRSSGCQGNDLCVATSSTWDRDSGSTHWRLLGPTPAPYRSSTGKFCYDTSQDAVVLANDVATLKWDTYGNLSLFDNDDPALATTWGIGSEAPLTGQNLAHLCFDGTGNMAISDHTGAIVWQSSSGATVNNQLVLDHCTASIVSSSGTKWSVSTEACDRTHIATKGWCKDRPVGSNMPILWKDGVELDWQADGNLVLSTNEASFQGTSWASNTSGTGQKLCYQTDGNLVVYDGNGAAVWAANSVGSSALDLDQCGAFADFQIAGRRELWRTNASHCGAQAIDHNGGVGWCRSRGAAGTVLESEASHLEWQTDGNLVLYRSSDGKALFASNTAGTGTWLCFQGDGNLVVYDGSNTARWAANSVGGTQLSLNGCAVEIENPGANAVEWNAWTGTGCVTSVPQGGFSFVFDESYGDSDFGAEVWAVAGATNAAAINAFRASIPGTGASNAVAGLLPSPVPGDLVEVLGDAGASATIFSTDVTVLELGGYVRHSSGAGDSGCHITVMGSSVPCSLTLTNTTNWEHPVPFVDKTKQFMLGGVLPVTVHADVTGTIGVALTLTGTPVSLGGSVTPSANLTVNASAGVGVEGFSAGIEGSLTLVEVSAPLTLTLDFPLPGLSASYAATGSLTESTLAGSLDLYADATFFKYSYELASWDGYSFTQPLFSSNGSL